MGTLFKGKGKITIAIASIVAVLAAVVFTCIPCKKNVATINVQKKMAMSYEQLTDAGMLSEVMNSQTGEPVINAVTGKVETLDSVIFGAYFEYDINDDNKNEHILGTCKELSQSDTLILDINISGDGYLRDGVISIDAQNFTYSLGEVKDDAVLSENYIQDNVRTVTLKNQVQSGSQRMMMGTIHSKLGGNVANYSRENSVILTGTYVVEDEEGEIVSETPIKKECKLKVDWYGDARAKITNTGRSKRDFASYNNVHQIPQSEKELKFYFTLGLDKEENTLLVKSHHVEIDIPTLRNKFPKSVRCDKEYTYDEENHKLIIDLETSSIEASYNVFLVYPDEVYAEVITDNQNGVVDTIHPQINGYIECHNNPNEGFRNPYITNTVSRSATIEIGNYGSHAASHSCTVSIINTQNVKFPTEQKVLSKASILDAFDTNEPAENMKYVVRWAARRERIDTANTTLIITDTGDAFGNSISNSSPYIKSTGIYFGSTWLLPDDAIITISDAMNPYNSFTLTKEELSTYKSTNPMMFNEQNEKGFSEPVRAIKVETTEDSQSQNSLEIYTIKEINVEKLKEDYRRSDIEDINAIETRASFGGNNMVNTWYEKDIVDFVAPRSYTNVSITPNRVSTTEDEYIDAQIKIKVPASSATTAEWRNGKFEIEIPSEIIEMELVGEAVSSKEEIKINNTSLYKRQNGNDYKYFVKVETTNDAPTSDFEITVNCKMGVDTMTSTSQKQIKLYTYNENCKMYYNSEKDAYDINGDENTNEVIGSSTGELSIIAASGFVTTETITNYGKDDEITKAGNCAEVTQDVTTATVNVEFRNNYTQKVTNVSVLGKVPFAGNTYMNGQTLNSEFTTTMKSTGIQVAENITNTVTIYYSKEENPTKQINLPDNHWIPSGDVESEDWAEIKTYLIVVEGDINGGKTYKFTYDININQPIEPNLAAFACHVVDLDIVINEANTHQTVQSRKVGIRIAKYFGMEVTKYRELLQGKTNKRPVKGAMYTLTETDKDGKKIQTLLVSGNDGILRPQDKPELNTLRVNQEYEFKEVSSPIDYELNTKVVTFVVEEDGSGLKYNVLGEENFDEEVQINQVNGKYVLTSAVYDTPKYQINITKVKTGTNEKLSNVRFLIDSKIYDTNSEGNTQTQGLLLNKEYTLNEMKAEGYFLDDRAISLEKSEDGTLSFTSKLIDGSGNLVNDTKIKNVTIVNDDDKELIQVNITLENDEIPVYNLQVIKVEENNNITDLSKLKRLKDAQFMLYRDDSGKEEIKTTDENGEIDYEILYQYVAGKSDKESFTLGKYVLKELKAPYGYANNSEEIIFKLQYNSEEEKLELITENAEGAEPLTSVKQVIIGEDNNVTIIVQDKPQFRVTKVDEDNNPLANVEFVISEINDNGDVIGYAKDVNGNFVGTQNEKGQYILKTDENGTISVPLKNGKYEMVEVSKLEGFEEKEVVEYFEITSNGPADSAPLAPDPEPAPSGGDAPSSPSGTTIEIGTIDELIEFSNKVNSGTYVGVNAILTDDIDFSGTDNSIKIRTVEDLVRVGNEIITYNGYEGYQIVLENDLDIENDVYDETLKNQLAKSKGGAGLTPIGGVGAPNFKGVFDGKGHKIQNLYVNPTGNYSGLFGYVYGGMVCNLEVTGYIATKSYTGIAGQSQNAIFVNCINRATIEGGTGSAGGIIGQDAGNSKIENCKNFGTVSGNYSGGIVGQTCTSTAVIEGCYNNQEISGSMVGGIVGISSTTIRKCYNNGEINATSCAGGIAGLTYAPIQNCYNTKNINGGSAPAGGIAGVVDSGGSISNCYNIGNVSCSATANGIAGGTSNSASASDITNSYYLQGITVTSVHDFGFGTETSMKTMKSDSFVTTLGNLNWTRNNSVNNGYPTLVIDESSIQTKVENYKDGKINNSISLPSAMIPIGTESYPFSGTFDGDGHEIKNLILTKNSGIHGLFGVVSDATIKNLNVSGKISGLSGFSSTYVGGIVAYAKNGDTTITNCNYTGNINHSSGYVGGIVGYSTGANLSISRCSETVNFETNSSATGGIIGYADRNTSTSIEKCTVNGTITANNIQNGGIIGAIYYGSGSVSECTNNIRINAPSQSYCGGIIGHSQQCNPVNVSKCSNYAYINCGDRSGGIVGDIDDSYNVNISECHNYGEICGNDSTGDVGGIVGVCDTPTITKCTNENKVSGGSYVGGIVGYADDSVEISYCENKDMASILGRTDIGGIIGYAYYDGTISNCINSATITMKYTNSNVNAGGIIGKSGKISLLNCINRGAIYGNYNLGGISGKDMGGTKFTSCINEGKIICEYGNGVSGIVGGTSGTGKNLNCINRGDILVKNGSGAYIHGIGYGGKPENCYNAGNITVESGGCTQIGGISSQEATNCYNTGNIYVKCHVNYVSGVSAVYNATRCYNTGDIIIEYGADVVSGVAYGNATDCYNTGNLIVNQVNYVNGVSNGTPKNCYNTGNIISTSTNPNNKVGIINCNGYAQNCYYLGSIKVEATTIVNGEKVKTQIDRKGEMVSSDTLKSPEMCSIAKLNVNRVWSYRGYTYPKLSAMPMESSEYVDLTVQNVHKQYAVRTRVISINGVDGGTISKTDDIVYEYIKYNEDNKKAIEMISNDGYTVYSVMINGESVPFEVDDNNNYTIPAGYFKNVMEDKDVIVTFTPSDKLLSITKVDKYDNTKVLEGAKFRVSQVEDRAPITTEMGCITGTGPGDITSIDESEEISDVIGNRFNDSSWYFKGPDGDGIYESNNQGRNKTTAHSYVEIDLTNKTGYYAVKVNGTVSSESDDKGRAIINTNKYTSLTDQKIFEISGNQSNITGTSGALKAGRKYYLHFEYEKDRSYAAGSDSLKINWFKVYRASAQDYGFTKNEDNQYVPNNKGILNKTADSYIPIDLTDREGYYELKINAELSAGSGDSAFIAVTNSPITPESYISKLFNGTGVVEANDYTQILSGGNKYYVHFEYKKGSTAPAAELADSFTINSVEVLLSEKDFYSKEAVTDGNGKILLALKYAKYKIEEIEPPEGYSIETEPIYHTINSTSDNNLVFENAKAASVMVHYYEKGTTNPVRDSIELKGQVGEKYNSETFLKVGEYTLEKDEEDEYIIPENASGTFRAYDESNPQEVIYYYVKPEYGYTLRYFYDGAEQDRETAVADKGTIIKYIVKNQNIAPAAENGEEGSNPAGNEGSTSEENVIDIAENIENHRPTGYYLDSISEPLPLTIQGNASEHVIDIYYEKDSLKYSVNYYYGGVLAEDETVNYSAQLGAEVSGYVEKARDHYHLDRVKAVDENGNEKELPLIINAYESEAENTNKINVYYEKDSFGYEIHYFYGDTVETATEQEAHPATTGLKALFGSQIKQSDIETQINANKIDGYKFETAKTVDKNGTKGNMPLTISHVEENNKINVYYIKDSFGYEIHYFYGDTVETATEQEAHPATTGLKAPYGSVITEENIQTYINANKIDGYKFEETKTQDKNGTYGTLPLTITSVSTNNKINVYYVKDSFGYEVHYYYNNEELENHPADKGTAPFGSTIELEQIDQKIKDNLIDGYKFVSVTTIDEEGTKQDLPLTITSNENNNIIRVDYAAIEAFVVTEKHIEILKDGTENILYTDQTSNITGEEITINRREFPKYKAADRPENAEPVDANVYVMEKEETTKTIEYKEGEEYEVWYYYIKKNSTITVQYLDNLTEQPITKPGLTNPEIITGIIDEPYTVTKKDIPGYKLDTSRLPENETGEFTEEGDIVRYYYIELKQYDLQVIYTANGEEIDEAKIVVKDDETIVKDSFTKNGVLDVGKLEITDLITKTYTIYETQTPEFCKTVVSEEAPAVVEITSRLNKSEKKYEFVVTCNNIEGVKARVDDANKKILVYIETVKEEKYDLAIKKFITSIDSQKITDREPIVTVSKEGKITYKGNDRIEKAANNQLITYTIRTYNESEIKAKGKRIIEYIPKGLVFVPENETNKKYDWKMYKSDGRGNFVRTTNVEEADIVLSDDMVNKVIPAVDMTKEQDSEKVSYIDIQVVFKVDETKVTQKSRIVENKVQIMPNPNDNNPENDVSIEKVYIKYFDLTLTKYIETVKINTNGREEVRHVGVDKKGELVKVDVNKSQVNNTKLTVTYGIIVKNVGEIAGYASEVKDYIPENFELVSTSDWRVEGKEAITTALKETRLEPGEQTTVFITFEWQLSEASVGTRYNEAEITLYTNDYNAKDPTDDNKDREGLIVALKTGPIEVFYVGIAAIVTGSISTISLIIIGAWVFIKRRAIG